MRATAAKTQASEQKFGRGPAAREPGKVNLRGAPHIAAFAISVLDLFENLSGEV